MTIHAQDAVDAEPAVPEAGGTGPVQAYPAWRAMPARARSPFSPSLQPHWRKTASGP